jgi:hypothetical protein
MDNAIDIVDETNDRNASMESADTPGQQRQDCLRPQST